MKTLYVTDLDGTLLNQHDSISDFSIQTINQLVAEGMQFTYATARSLVSASVVTKGLSTDIPVIAYNGVLMIHPSSGQVLSFESMSKNEAKDVELFLRERNILPLVYAYINGTEHVSWMEGHENEGMLRYLSLRKGDKRLRPIHTPDELYAGDIFYYTCIGEEGELQPVYQRFSQDKHYRCTIQQELYRPEYWCEIMPAKATKAHAIMKMKQILGCDRVVSFGDAINDIPMFQVSDESYAVENAVSGLKEIATGVIDSNEDDGVAKWLLTEMRKKGKI